MVGSPRFCFCVLTLSLAAFSQAEAFGGRFSLWSSASTPAVTYSYAVPTYVYPSYYCVPSPRIVPVPDAPTMPYARPTPAPPSQSPEPPLNQAPNKLSGDFAAPMIVSTHSQNTPGPVVSKDRCRVGFWNLTGRDVTLTIDGKAWTLGKDRATTLELDRRFTWQADRQGDRTIIVPDGQNTYEVVIR